MASVNDLGKIPTANFSKKKKKKKYLAEDILSLCEDAKYKEAVKKVKSLIPKSAVRKVDETEDLTLIQFKGSGGKNFRAVIWPSDFEGRYTLVDEKMEKDLITTNDLNDLIKKLKSLL